MVTAAEIIRVPLECPLAAPYRGTLAVIGNMDGVHRGHQALVKKGRELAEKARCPLSVVVFDPHPREIFQPDAPPFILTRLETKAQFLGTLGVKFIFVLPFIEALYTQTPETFVKLTLGKVMGLNGMVTGTDFRFGAGRSGDVTALSRLADEAGMSAHAIEPILFRDGEKISSSGARNALREGKPEDAARMLGHPFTIRGDVLEGKKLARTLDFPTANISLGPYIRPKFGVYIIRTNINGVLYNGIANIGIRPTVGGETELLEAHLFDFDGNLYGKTLDVTLLHFMRPEQKFAGIDTLKSQIAQDAIDARAWHTAHPE